MRKRRGEKKRGRRQTDGTSRPEKARPKFRMVLVAAGAVLLLTIHGLLADTSIRNKCSTFDEVSHLTKGYAWWNLDDKRLMPEHPPLAQAWAALPLLDDGLKFPGLDSPAWHRSAVITIGKTFFYQLGNDSDAMLRSARRMIILISVALGIVVFLWSARLFGVAGGFVSLILYTFSPSVLAHARLVTTDMCVSLFFMLSVASIWWVMHQVRPASLLAGFASVAGLILSKMSGVLIIPVAVVLVIVRLVSGRLLNLRLGKTREIVGRPKLALSFAILALVHTAVVWLVIWATFGFRYEAMADAQPGRDRFFTPGAVPADKTVWAYQGRGIPVTAAAVDWARDHRLLPEAYLYGFLFTMQSARGRDAFLDGDRNLTGWRSFFPLCFLYKVPLPIMGVIMAAGLSLLVGRSGRVRSGPAKQAAQRGGLSAGLYATAPLWTLIVIYWGFAITSHLNIGHRHILPTFAPMFVLCGATAVWIRGPGRWMRGLIVSLLGLLIISSMGSWPHYLAHFNLMAGGPSQGYRHLVDSSLDWGQDLPGLAQWLDENGADQRVYLSYFGTGNPKRHGIDAERLPQYLSRSGTGDFRLKEGLYCISATRLQQVYALPTTEWTAELERRYQRHRNEIIEFQESPDNPQARSALLQRKGKGFRKRFNLFAKLQFGRLCAYLRKREPDHHVGHSILIYRVTEKEIGEALSGPLP